MSNNILNVIAFPGAPNLPTFAAMEHGQFLQRGFDVNLELTPSSIYQAEETAAGNFDIICTAFDNVVAYGSGQGAAGAGVNPDYVVLMGATQLELSLITAPSINNISDLAGKSIALDALTTGFAFVLFDMLESAGIARSDVEFVAVGATPQRWQSVKDGNQVATLTIEPFTSLALLEGFNVVAKSTDFYSEYQGGVIATTRSLLANQPEKAKVFIEAYLKGLTWVLDPSNVDHAQTLLSSRMPQIRQRAMLAVMSSLTSPKSGLTPFAALLDKGMDQVVDLRKKYGSSSSPIAPVANFLDLSLYTDLEQSSR
ncbi:MAG: ABC transporter substrate-binding protein [SAR116 cluster bacterium]|nr:ABC transporter substrate-binding protein [Paracoccaceae bacterium]RCL78643.1 MAG: ABC transporter substrate-binding protein [SAR116 cluster bacterium]RPH13509.1 MAG: ABC transporter substrate-binding protein [Alphaproteobacteria bacterium TMED150]